MFIGVSLYGVGYRCIADIDPQRVSNKWTFRQHSGAVTRSAGNVEQATLHEVLLDELISVYVKPERFESSGFVRVNLVRHNPFQTCRVDAVMGVSHLAAPRFAAKDRTLIQSAKSL